MGFAGDTFFLLELLVHNIVKQLPSKKKKIKLPPPKNENLFFCHLLSLIFFQVLSHVYLDFFKWQHHLKE